MKVQWGNLIPIRTLVLVLVGFGALVTAAWMFHTIMGIAALGIACLILEFLLSTEEKR